MGNDNLDHLNRQHVARQRREVELSVHYSSLEHQRRWSVLIRTNCARYCMIWRARLTIETGKQKVMYALTKIKGVGKRYSNLVCKKADVDLTKRYARPCIHFLRREGNGRREAQANRTMQRWRSHLGRTRAHRHHHAEPNAIQDPNLVPQPTARHC